MVLYASKPLYFSRDESLSHLGMVTWREWEGSNLFSPFWRLVPPPSSSERTSEHSGCSSHGTPHGNETASMFWGWPRSHRWSTPHRCGRGSCLACHRLPRRFIHFGLSEIKWIYTHKTITENFHSNKTIGRWILFLKSLFFHRF